MYQQIAKAIQSLVGNEYLYLDSPIVVRSYFPAADYRGWALCVSPDGTIYIMDAYQQWESVSEEDEMMIGVVWEKMKSMVQTAA